MPPRLRRTRAERAAANLPAPPIDPDFDPEDPSGAKKRKRKAKAAENAAKKRKIDEEKSRSPPSQPSVFQTESINIGNRPPFRQPSDARPSSGNQGRTPKSPAPESTPTRPPSRQRSDIRSPSRTQTQNQTPTQQPTSPHRVFQTQNPPTATPPRSGQTQTQQTPPYDPTSSPLQSPRIPSLPSSAGIIPPDAEHSPPDLGTRVLPSNARSLDSSTRAVQLDELDEEYTYDPRAPYFRGYGAEGVRPPATHSREGEMDEDYTHDPHVPYFRGHGRGSVRGSLRGRDRGKGRGNTTPSAAPALPANPIVPASRRTGSRWMARRARPGGLRRDRGGIATGVRPRVGAGLGGINPGLGGINPGRGGINPSRGGLDPSRSGLQLNSAELRWQDALYQEIMARMEARGSGGIRGRDRGGGRSIGRSGRSGSGAGRSPGGGDGGAPADPDGEDDAGGDDNEQGFGDGEDLPPPPDDDPSAANAQPRPRYRPNFGDAIMPEREHEVHEARFERFRDRYQRLEIANEDLAEVIQFSESFKTLIAHQFGEEAYQQAGQFAQRAGLKAKLCGEIASAADKWVMRVVRDQLDDVEGMINTEFYEDPTRCDVGGYLWRYRRDKDGELEAVDSVNWPRGLPKQQY